MTTVETKNEMGFGLLLCSLLSGYQYFRHTFYVHVQIYSDDKYSKFLLNGVGQSSAAGIATYYKLDIPGIQSWWGQYFPHLSRLALGPIQLPVK